MAPVPQSPPHSKPNSPTKLTSNETSNPRLVTKSPATPASSAAEPHRYVWTLLFVMASTSKPYPAELRNRAVRMVADIPIRAWVELGGDRIGGREAGHRKQHKQYKTGSAGPRSTLANPLPTGLRELSAGGRDRVSAGGGPPAADLGGQVVGHRTAVPAGRFACRRARAGGLGAAVPSVAGWGLTSLHVGIALSWCPRCRPGATATARWAPRDYAILLVLARLGPAQRRSQPVGPTTGRTAAP